MKLFYLSFAGLLYLASFAGDVFAQSADHYLTIQLDDDRAVLQL
ncbi:peptidylprolyl isomerase, partial [Rhizobium ruizarguesonis]